jgi:hypothetical protein
MLVKLTTVCFAIHWHSHDDDRLHIHWRLVTTAFAAATASFIRLGGADAADAAHVATQTGSEFFAHDKGLTERSRLRFVVVVVKQNLK